MGKVVTDCSILDCSGVYQLNELTNPAIISIELQAHKARDRHAAHWLLYDVATLQSPDIVDGTAQLYTKWPVGPRTSDSQFLMYNNAKGIISLEELHDV